LSEEFSSWEREHEQDNDHEGLEDKGKRKRKQKLHKTDNESVNIQIVALFQKCFAMGIAVTGAMICSHYKGKAIPVTGCGGP
jgi:hypothetical protein